MRNFRRDFSTAAGEAFSIFIPLRCPRFPCLALPLEPVGLGEAVGGPARAGDARREGLLPARAGFAPGRPKLAPQKRDAALRDVEDGGGEATQPRDRIARRLAP